VTRAERIADERARMRLAPWQFAPSEVTDAAAPWPPASAGYRSWHEAQQWRAEILELHPHYFDDKPRK
jgi:hypothetical protein